MRETCPNAKILITLRDPVERIFSEYIHRTGLGLQQVTLKRFVDMRAKFYHPYVKDWIGAFGRNNVRVVMFEEFVRDQKGSVADMLEWLGLDDWLGSFKPRHDNRTTVQRNSLAGTIHGFYLEKRTGVRFKMPVPQVFRKLVKYGLFQTEKTTLGSDDREAIRGLFRDDVMEMEAVLGRRLP